MRPIGTITRADEIRRVKSRFPRLLRVFPHSRCEAALGRTAGAGGIADEVAATPGRLISRQVVREALGSAYWRSIQPDITVLQPPPMNVPVTAPSTFSATALRQARSPQIDALSNGGFQSQGGFRPQMGKEADKGNSCAACRRVFKDPMQRREHSRVKVGALSCLLDVQMNSGYLVSRQENIHALLRSPQRGSITHFGYNEWRAAAAKARGMPAHLDIRRLERACLRDHCDVEIANDPELLGCGR
jgi:hypothetical protein